MYSIEHIIKPIDTSITLTLRDWNILLNFLVLLDFECNIYAEYYQNIIKSIVQALKIKIHQKLTKTANKQKQPKTLKIKLNPIEIAAFTYLYFDIGFDPNIAMTMNKIYRQIDKDKLSRTNE